MKKHIFAMAVITLTVGCQPNSSGSKESQNETGPAAKLEKHILSGSDKGLTKTTVEKTTLAKSDVLAHLSAKTLEVATRLQMEFASNKSSEAVLFQKLFSLKGAGNLTVTEALRKKKIDLRIEIKDLEDIPDKDVQIQALALAYKEIARVYGFTAAEQETIANAIRNRSSLLTPTESQKALIKTSTQVVQDKATDLARNLITDESAKLPPAVKSLQEALQAFVAKDSSYKLPSNASLLATQILQDLSKLESAFAKNALYGKSLLGKVLPAIVDQLNYLQARVTQYISPLSKTAQPEMVRFMEMGLLKETKEYRLSQGLTAEGMLEFKDVDCRVNGRQIIFIPSAPNRDLLQAEGDLTIKGQKPFFARKIKSQRGLSFGVVYKDFEISSQKGMTPVTTDKGEPGLVVTLIPREDHSFEFTYKEGNSSHKVSCSTK